MSGEIKSSIGRRSFSASSGERKFVVDDPTETPVQKKSSVEEALEFRRQALEQAKAEESVQFATGAKRRIEMLTEIARAFKDVDITHEGQLIQFKLQTLKSREIRKVAEYSQALARKEDPGFLFKVRCFTLANSLQSVGGVLIDDMLETSGMDEDLCLDLRCQFLEELDETLVQLLFKSYDALVRENNIKFGVTSEQAAKEVAEQTKKSGERA